MAHEADETADNTIDPKDEDQKLAKLVNAAVSSQLKRQMRGLGDSLGAMLDERFTAMGLSGKAQGTTITAPEKDAPNAEIEKLRAELKAQGAEMKAQKLRAFEKEAMIEVKSILTGRIRPEMMETALKVVRANGNIKIDSKDGSATYKSEELGEVDLTEGLMEWIQGEGAVFAPTQLRQKPRVTSPAKAPVRPSNLGDENLTPAQRTQRALAAKGLSLTG